MTKVRGRGEDVRKFILDHVEKHPADISRVTADHFGITRQAVHKHLQKLAAENALSESGYKLAAIVEWKQVYKIITGLAEDIVWRNDIRGTLGNLPVTPNAIVVKGYFSHRGYSIHMIFCLVVFIFRINLGIRKIGY